MTLDADAFFSSESSVVAIDGGPRTSRHSATASHSSVAPHLLEEMLVLLPLAHAANVDVAT